MPTERNKEESVNFPEKIFNSNKRKFCFNIFAFLKILILLSLKIFFLHDEESLNQRRFLANAKMFVNERGKVCQSADSYLRHGGRG